MADEERGGEAEITHGFDLLVMQDRAMLDAVTMIGAGRILQGGRIGLQRVSMPASPLA
ncbi:hypothetical protein VXQ18_04945 [Brucella abortus]|nr:hypothetical protein [Brucella abortus]